MRWLRKLSLSNRLALFSLIVAVITLIVTLLPIKTDSDKKTVTQSAIGNESPVIHAGGNVKINFQE